VRHQGPFYHPCMLEIDDDGVVVAVHPLNCLWEHDAPVQRHPYFLRSFDGFIGEEVSRRVL
jgi:hypothetical protein